MAFKRSPVRSRLPPPRKFKAFGDFAKGLFLSFLKIFLKTVFAKQVPTNFSSVISNNIYHFFMQILLFDRLTAKDICALWRKSNYVTTSKKPYNTLYFSKNHFPSSSNKYTSLPRIRHPVYLRPFAVGPSQGQRFCFAIFVVFGEYFQKKSWPYRHCLS